jgi:hypothetical protein
MLCFAMTGATTAFEPNPSVDPETRNNTGCFIVRRAGEQDFHNIALCKALVDLGDGTDL